MDFTRRETLAILSGLAVSPSIAGEQMPTQIAPLSPQSGDGVFAVIGQSNHGFYGDVAQTTSAPGAYFFDLNTGNWYDCCDPLPGWSIPAGTGTGGSIWSRLAHYYNTSSYKPWNRLIFVMAVVNGSGSPGWKPGGAHYAGRAVGANSAMVQRGFSLTSYLWGLGEKDNAEMVAGVRLPGEHKANVEAMIDGLRGLGISAPVLMARCSLYRQNVTTTPFLDLGPDFASCSHSERLLRTSAEAQIMKEQAWLAGNLAAKQAYDGAWLDQISAASRWDGGHLDSAGQDLAAQLWLDVLLRYKQVGMI